MSLCHSRVFLTYAQSQRRNTLATMHTYPVLVRPTGISASLRRQCRSKVDVNFSVGKLTLFFARYLRTCLNQRFPFVLLVRRRIYLLTRRHGADQLDSYLALALLPAYAEIIVCCMFYAVCSVLCVLCCMFCVVCSVLYVLCCMFCAVCSVLYVLCPIGRAHV